MIKPVLTVALATGLLIACGKKIGPAAPEREAPPETETTAPAEPAQTPATEVAAAPAASRDQTCGEASWYGDELRGRPTASGEPFVPEGLTAAHKTLPLGTEILVEYQGKTVQVRINDRGPYHGGRILDLSKGAADQLGYTSLGAAEVCFSIVS